MQISVSHLTQVDRHHDNMHRTPIIHQVQNAQRAEDEAARRMNMPVEPDAVEKKSIDPDRKRHDRHERRNKRPGHAEGKEEPAQRSGAAPIIDISV